MIIKVEISDVAAENAISPTQLSTPTSRLSMMARLLKVPTTHNSRQEEAEVVPVKLSLRPSNKSAFKIS
jgi:hypothetical protein